jgi:hypothetical protein
MLAELNARTTLSQTAGVCAALLAGMLRARAVLIHAYDPCTDELRVIGADGVDTHDLLGARHSVEDDFVASTVVANRSPMTLRLEGELPLFAPARLREVGATQSFLALPVSTSSGCIAIIEVIDGEALGDAALEACRSAASALVRCHAAYGVAA